jgi:aarF domain-containing kinase
MLEEVDFRKEAMNIDSFRNYVEVMGLAKQATAPFVYRHCSTQRVLTMERLYGVPLTDLNSIRSIVPSPEATLITALNVWFGSLIACETFHADVHAGNLLVLNDGRVGFIDFGIVGRISPPTWAAMETFLASVGNGQYTAMATALVQMGATDSAVDITSFSRDLEKIFSAVQDLDTDVLITTTAGGPGSATVAATMAIDEQQINALLLDVIRVSEAYGLKFPREFGLLLKQLLYFDRYTRLLAPNLNVLEDDRISLRNRGSQPDPFGPRQPRF